MSKPKQTRWFKSGRVDFTGAGKIDAEKSILYGVIMCQVGEAKGHGVHLEQEFIDAGISYAQKYHKKGMKARFGHPSMSNETLGTEMGRFKNFRVEGEKMVADLHLFEAANLSPTQPGMRDWMLSIAQEDPEAIMCSIVFLIGSFYQRNKEGEKFEIEFVPKGWNGEWRSKDDKNTFDPDAKIYVSLKELMFCDIVDQGAATEKLFSEQFNDDKFAVLATQFFNEYPQIDGFVQEHPDKILEFLSNRFGIAAEPEPGLIDKFIGLFKPKQSNQIEFYMSKVQLSKLAALAEKLKDHAAGSEDYAAVAAELQEQGVDVVVMGSSNHEALLSNQRALGASIADAVRALEPDTPEDQVTNVNLSEAIKKRLAEKDQEIAELKKQLGDKGEKPTPAANGGKQQVFEEEEDETPLSESEKQSRELAKLAQDANELMNS